MELPEPLLLRCLRLDRSTPVLGQENRETPERESPRFHEKIATFPPPTLATLVAKAFTGVNHSRMSDTYETLAAFVLLAKAEEQRLNLMDRDRVLVIAATIASERHMEALAGYLRHLVLEHNSGHMLKKYPTLYEALVDPDFQHFLKVVRRKYPFERVEQLLTEHGVDFRAPEKGERTELDVLAGILGVDPVWIERNFSAEP